MCKPAQFAFAKAKDLELSGVVLLSGMVRPFVVSWRHTGFNFLDRGSHSQKAILGQVSLGSLRLAQHLYSL